jgi:anion-transporting  ArsA/GET3 family ATPase
MTANPVQAAHPGMGSMLSTARLVVCVGSGGVGKTTTSAVLALSAAQLGRRAIVITIDPARRLARALGLEEIGNAEKPIPRELFATADTPETGACAAMMLDVRTTFDDLIERVSPDAATRERILKNNVYRHISTAIAGSQEYMATEKVFELVHSGRYDVVILDTPPMKNALDFLEAQNRMLQLVDESVIKWFVKPYEFDAEGRVIEKRGTGNSLIFKLLGYVLGDSFMGEVSEFFQSFARLVEGFRTRNEAVAKILRDPTSHFVIVTSPKAQVVSEAIHFHRDLNARQLPFGGFIINQVSEWQQPLGEGPGATGGESAAAETLKADELATARAELDQLARDMAATHPEFPKLVERIEALATEAEHEARKDRERLRELMALIKPGDVFRLVPRLPEDVHDIRSLLRLQPWLMG